MSAETPPFLPEPDPPPPAPKSRTKRTLLLWVLLIFMFLAIWQFLSPGPSSSTHATAPSAPPCENSSGTFWTSTLPSMLPLGVLVLVVVWFFGKMREVTTFNLSQEPGRLALAERRFSDAAEIFRATATAHSKQPFYQGLATFNLACTQLWSGQLVEAISSLARVEKVNLRDLHGPLRSSGLRMKAAYTLVLANGLLGDLDTAERWAEDTRVRLAKNKEDRLFCAAHLCLGEAVVPIRRGRPADALASLEKNWLTLRATLTANDVRVAEILRAFAEANGGVREYNTVSERLIRVEPVSAKEFAFLGVRWPAMQSFLVAHHLVPTDGSPTPA